MKLISTIFSAMALVGVIFVLSGNSEAQTKAHKIAVLLVDGQNNYAWAEISPVLKEILEETGKFEVTISTSPAGLPRAPRPPKEKIPEAKAKFADSMKAWEIKVAELKASSAGEWEKWNPDFASYDVVVSNYNGEL